MNIKFLKKTAKLLFLLVVLILNSCASRNKVFPPCPGIYLEQDTVSGVLFQEGKGRDLTDKILEVEVMGYEGFCKFSKDLKKVEVRLNVLFDATLGGAAKSRDVSFDYFVAVPDFYPLEQAKQVFNVKLNFPEGI